MSMNFDDCAKVRGGFPKPFPDTSSNVFEQFNMKGKVVVVTGAGDGIGLAVAEAMAEANASVAFWYNSNDVAIQRAEEVCQRFGVKTIAYKVDVSDAQQVQKAVAKVESMAISKPILEQSLEEFDKQMSVNVNGVVYCAKYVGEVFKRQGAGNLIITSSMSGHIVNVPTDQPVYNASKAYVTHFGKSLAREWREFARVNIVSPGFFDTKMGASPLAVNEAYRMAVLGRQGHVKEIKGIYLYLASDASTYTTGSDFLIDGGSRICFIQLPSAMLKFAVLCLTGLALIAENVTATNVSYRVRYKRGFGGKPGWTNYAQVISDSNEAALVEKMSHWSHDKYTATKDELSGWVLLEAESIVQTRADADAGVKEMAATVCSHLKECGSVSR
ncbi:L-xylulose reductase [Pochonia chlamydosporia 170]|uniref:L-xylulose reductase n=1 Tax=Pochonia chlamydosporia 170 TaxID=1380566 RepID=A0A179F2H8_METCM|nr:L-xylulose reductase [Pochonia chlamydosporia 170]OAQ59520.2 L-xylulose reductase [Pochonia chlamydosporia 170]